MKNEQVKCNLQKASARIIFKNDITSVPKDGNICSLHYHDELEFLPVFDGEICAVVDDIEYRASAGSVIFINSRVPHYTRAYVPYNSGLIQFRESDFLNSEISRAVKYSARLGSIIESRVRILHSEELFEIFKDMAKEIIEKNKAYELFLKSGIYRILGCLYRDDVLIDSEELYNTKETQKILPVLNYINENYGCDITLDVASEMLGFDQSYFCRIFKAATGATFTEYLNFVRICRAEKMLSRTQKSILEISEEVGFSSVSYFNRVFKKYRHCSPQYYRKALYCNM